eukprot:TRINITY_DN6355_c0_g1_i3.p1 TRINITY_DN6355_c0_g1~~TRINITY_DN6355_c0_g1_i3.p1  ORF type:complete len:128 (-),score=23.42 TRINITY_DN6355_c0_g1_i3:25-408(-)
MSSLESIESKPNLSSNQRRYKSYCAAANKGPITVEVQLTAVRELTPHSFRTNFVDDWIFSALQTHLHGKRSERRCGVCKTKTVFSCPGCNVNCHPTCFKMLHPAPTTSDTSLESSDTEEYEFDDDTE